MSSETCILTTKDFTILEIMRDRCLGTDDALLPLLRRKLGSALVVFRDDMPDNVATLNSRIAFSVNGGEEHTRIISHDGKAPTVGLFLPVTTLRGLALLGLTEGQEFRFRNRDGAEETILLRKVLYQPEVVRRDKQAPSLMGAPAEKKPVLKLVQGGSRGQPAQAPVGPGGFDDPGPSAA
jgi:regulator of nucleoside diphosphate kinase